MQRYNPKDIEPKWQQVWAEQGLYEAKDFDDKPKFVMLTEFPYPSGDGLHMGHIREYTYGDILARQKRMQGRNVLYPMGFDEFGLPTENYAIKNKVTPQSATATNVATFEQQMKSLGLGFAWSRKVNTSDPRYYKWTQWLFLQFFKAALAYQDEIAINWCPHCKTGLSNEEVVNGRHERCDTIVEKKLLKQWLLKITAYADRLLEGLKTVDYPSRIADQQVNWIGRSEGAEIDFTLDDHADYVLLHGFTASPESDFLPNFVKKLKALKQKVYVPQLPNTNNPTVVEQAKFVLDNYQFTDQTVLMGHSLGSVVALKVVEQLEKPIKRLVLVAGFAQPGFPDKKRPFEDTFDWQFDFEKIRGIAEEIVILRADKDVPVLPERADYLSEKLGVQVTDFIAEANHATGEKETEVWQYTTKSMPVFTTRPDTIFGATFLVLAPEHKLVRQITADEHRDTVNSYVKQAQAKTDIERQTEGREKTGVFTGAYAVNPATNKKIPIWIADYVLAGYGTGAIMAVPAHDERDWEFAKKYNLPIVRVIQNNEADDVYTRKPGKLINSGDFDDMDSKQAQAAIIDFLESEGLGSRKIQYKLRDWIFSRQHYWGEPIPIIHCPEHGAVAVPDDQLPVELPPIENYEPTDTGESPLAQVSDWVNVACPVCGQPAKRETDTMPNWAGSSWYYLRYYDPHNEQAFADPKKLDYWGMVDMYLGGMEHTTLHLLYSRFWHQFLYDQKLVPTPEPYAARRGQGIILAADGSKMSKSKGNVVNPTDYIDSGYGADALRLAIAFLAPYDQTTPWSPEAVAGTHRFLQRVWTITQELQAADKKDTDIPVLQRTVHKAIKKVSEDLDTLNFNTAIAAMMEMINELYSIKAKQGFVAAFQPALESLLKLLSPFAPHIAEELWRQLGHDNSIHLSKWPTYDEKYLVEDTVTIVIQVNGRLRGEVQLSKDAPEDEVVQAAQAHEKVTSYLQDQTIRKIIYVPNKLVNFVI
jgi:leucyl-tRNA synthetase